MATLHVLLVDDNDGDNFLHQRVIAHLGIAHRISVAVNGAEALDLLRSFARDEFPELTLVDINMPIMNGWEFLERYEEEFGDRPDSVVIAMVSTSDSLSDISRAEEHGLVSRYIEKPLLREDVINILQAHFPDLAIPET